MRVPAMTWWHARNPGPCICDSLSAALRASREGYHLFGKDRRPPDSRYLHGHGCTALLTATLVGVFRRLVFQRHRLAAGSPCLLCPYEYNSTHFARVAMMGTPNIPPHPTATLACSAVREPKDLERKVGNQKLTPRFNKQRGENHWRPRLTVRRNTPRHHTF